MFGKDNKNNFKKKVNNNFSEKDFDEEKIIPDSIFRQNIKENKPKKVLNQIPYKFILKKINHKTIFNKIKSFINKFKIKEKSNFKKK